MQRSAQLTALLLSSAILVAPLSAQTGIALRGGTLGPGLEIAHQLRPWLSLRGGGTYLPLEGVEVTLEDPTVDIGFTIDATLNSFYLLADLMPIGGFLHLTAGAVYNAFTADAVGRPLSSYTLENRTFTRDQIGSVSAALEYENKIAPYAGIAFGNVANGRRVGITLDAGVIYSGPATVQFDATGMLEPTGEQDALIQEAVDGVEIYPVFSFGLVIRP